MHLCVDRCDMRRGGAAINKHIVKEQLKIPRPNIIWLEGGNGAGPLRMIPESFYASGKKEARRKHLAKALSRIPRPTLLSSSIEARWIDETGYSFPFGHAFSVMKTSILTIRLDKDLEVLLEKALASFGVGAQCSTLILCQGGFYECKSNIRSHG